MADVFFGYGSLVNLRTHDYHGPTPARLSGWRRVWVHTDRRPVAYLSAERADGVEIEGLLAEVPGGDWAALDLREAAYNKHPVAPFCLERREDRAAQVYAVAQGNGPTDAHPILLSYIDVVVQGYLSVFGEAGVERFFETTQGWHAPIRDDRAEPVYPRAQVLETREREMVDSLLRTATGGGGAST